MGPDYIERADFGPEYGSGSGGRDRFARGLDNVSVTSTCTCACTCLVSVRSGRGVVCRWPMEPAPRAEAQSTVCDCEQSADTCTIRARGHLAEQTVRCSAGVARSARLSLLRPGRRARAAARAPELLAVVRRAPGGRGTECATRQDET